MGKYLDILGLNFLWNKIKLKIVEIVEEKLSNYLTQFNTIQQEANEAKTESKYYYELMLDTVNSLDPDSTEILNYAQAIVKHGRAISKIAGQLNATYNENGITSQDEYTPGFVLKQVTQEEMDDMIANDETKDNEIYFVKE